MTLFDDDAYGLDNMRPAAPRPEPVPHPATDDGERDRERDIRATGMTDREIDADRLMEIEMGRGGPCP